MSIINKLAALDVKPRKGIGDARFGMPRRKVRSILNMPYTEFDKAMSGRNNVDAYKDFHAFYDNNDKLEALEFYGGNYTLNGRPMFPATMKLIKILAKDLKHGGDTSEGYVSKSNDMALWAPHGDIEAVLVGRKGYYSDDK